MSVNRTGGAKYHAPHVHREQPHAVRADKKSSRRPAPPPADRPASDEPPARLVAARQGLDTRVLRAQIEAKLAASPTATAAVSSGSRRRKSLDDYSQKLPTTGQPRDNPDRNRLVNLSKTSRSDGHTLYPSTLKRQAAAKAAPHLFDAKGESRGEIRRDSRFQADFSRPRRINGKTYVFARGVDLRSGRVAEGYVRKSLVNFDRAFRFDVRDGRPRPVLYDGMLNPRGELVARAGSVRLNFGQRLVVERMDNGRPVRETYYLVFDTKIKPDGPVFDRRNGTPLTEVAASSWIKESDLSLTAEERAQLRRMPSVTVKAPPGDAEYTPYVVRGDASGTDKNNYNTLVNVRRGDRVAQVRFADLKFAASRTAGIGNMEAGDYLTRDGGVVNMLYALPGGDGGITTTTLPADQGVVFQRWKDKNPPSVDVELYDPQTKRVARDAQGRKITMKFVHGYVDTPGGRRFGWIAYDVLAKAAQSAPQMTRGAMP